jgi:hypothetical protein
MAYEQLLVLGDVAGHILVGTADRRSTIMGEVNWETQDKQIPCPVSGSFKDLEVTLYTAPGGAGKKHVISLYVDNVKSALSVEVENTATTGSDSDSVAVTAGQTVEFKSEPVNTPANSYITVKMKFVPDDGESQIYFAWISNSTNTSVRWHPIMAGEGSEDSTEAEVTTPVAVAGTFSKFYCRNAADVGALPNNYIRTVYRNGGATGITCTLQTGTLIASDVVNSQAYSEGDTISVYQTTNSNPTFAEYGWSIAFVPTTAGEQFGHLTSSQSTTSAADTWYWAAFGAHYTAANAVEAQAQQEMHEGTIKRVRVLFDRAPNGAGKSYRIRSRVNGGYGNIDITVSNAETTGSDLVNSDALSDGDLFCWEIAPTGTPDTVRPFIACMYEVDAGAAATTPKPNVSAILVKEGML